MGNPDDIIIADFWRRFTDRRGGLGGTVSCREDLHRTLGEWSDKVRAALVAFLGDFRPDREEFRRRLGLHRRVRPLSEYRMRDALRHYAGGAFYRWLIDHEFPSQTASLASAAYGFHFEVRERE